MAPLRELVFVFWFRWSSIMWSHWMDAGKPAPPLLATAMTLAQLQLEESDMAYDVYCRNAMWAGQQSLAGHKPKQGATGGGGGKTDKSTSTLSTSTCTKSTSKTRVFYKYTCI